MAAMRRRATGRFQVRAKNEGKTQQSGSPARACECIATAFRLLVSTRASPHVPLGIARADGPQDRSGRARCTLATLVLICGQDFHLWSRLHGAPGDGVPRAVAAEGHGAARWMQDGVVRVASLIDLKILYITHTFKSFPCKKGRLTTNLWSRRIMS